MVMMTAMIRMMMRGDGSRVMILMIVSHNIFQKYAVDVRTVIHDNGYGDDDFGNHGEENVDK